MCSKEQGYYQGQHSGSAPEVRPQVSCNSLQEILSILEATSYPELTWVGKNYSKGDLIRDLNKLLEDKL